MLRCTKDTGNDAGAHTSVGQRYQEATMEATCKRLLTPGLIDAPLKLQLLLLFYSHPRYCGDARSLSEWLHEGPWAVREALDALSEAGLLGCVESSGRTSYRLEPSLEHWDTLEQLVVCYQDPLQRDQIYELLRQADRERRFRAILATPYERAFVG
jgi:hypothetical protein